MSQGPIYGTDASLTTTSFGCHWNAFELNIGNGVTSYYGFGDTWMTNHGTICSWSGSLAGFTSNGTTADDLGAPLSGGTVGIFTRAGISTLTLTWKTGCTVAGNAIITGLNAAVQFLGTDTSAYSFVGSGAPVEVWVVA